MNWWWRRKRPKHHTAPAVPDPRRLDRARREAERAHQQLDNARAQDAEVTKRSEHLEGVLGDNHLGPKFWEKALQVRRSQ